MNCFDYMLTKSAGDTYKIYHEVQSLRGYAIKIYRNHWEEALDKSFFHILKHYSTSMGELSNYTIRVVGTILLGKYKKDVPADELLQITMDEKSARDYDSDIPFDSLLEKESYISRMNFSKCCEEVLPYIIEDYKFFTTGKSSDRLLNYSYFFETYDTLVFKEALDYIKNEWKEEFELLKCASSTCLMKRVNRDRYLKDLDTSIEYLCKVQDTVLYKKKLNSHSKIFYNMNIRKNIAILINRYFYGSLGKNCWVKILNKDIFCTLEGFYVFGVEALIKALESELVGLLLARTSCFKVVTYEKGENLLLTCTRDITDPLVIDVFGSDFVVEFDKVASKRV